MNWRSTACAIGALALCGAPSTSFAQGLTIGATVESDGNCPSTQVVNTGVGRLVYETNKGALCISGTISASFSPFTPSSSGARMTQLSVLVTDSSETLPTGADVVVSDTDTANPIYCNVNGVAATTSDQKIPANSWFEFGIPGGITTLHCIATGGTVLANGVGGSGGAAGAGGGGGGSSGGGAVTLAAGSVSSGAYVSGALAAGSIVDIGTGASPSANTLNARLITLNTSVGGVTTALGSPFQAGGSIGNTGFGVTVGGNTAAVKAASTAPLATDPSLVITISPNSPAQTFSLGLPAGATAQSGNCVVATNSACTMVASPGSGHALHAYAITCGNSNTVTGTYVNVNDSGSHQFWVAAGSTGGIVLTVGSINWATNTAAIFTPVTTSVNISCNFDGDFI